jgi:hypothetical protein
MPPRPALHPPNFSDANLGNWPSCRATTLRGDTNRTITLLRHCRVIDDQHCISATDGALVPSIEGCRHG